MQITAIILAAGSGTRTGLKYNKILYEIHGKKLIDYSIETFKKRKEITEIVLVVSESEKESFISRYKDKVNTIISGGKERQDSVFKALSVAKNDYVLIHDGARPFIPEGSLSEMITKFGEEISMTLGVYVKDTIQKVSGNRVVETLKRSELIATQTPQGFNKEILIKSHLKAQKDRFIGTDDTMLVEKYEGVNAYLILGDYRNIKLTTLDDIKLLEVIL